MREQDALVNQHINVAVEASPNGAKPSSRSATDVDPEAVLAARGLLGTLADLRQQDADLPVPDLLRALGLVDNDGRLLAAGEILLCRPSADTIDILSRQDAGSEPSVQRLREPLVIALPRVVRSVTRALLPEVGHVALTDGQEITLPDFSPLAVDEAITNALVHRDWATQQTVVIDHAPQALRVRSPGGLPVGVSEDSLLSTVSTPRNPTLMGVLQQLGLVERASRGIDRMVREQIRVGQTQPTFEVDDFSVSVLFTSGAPNRAFARFVAGLPSSRRDSVDAMLVLRELCLRPTITGAQAAALLQVTEQEARHRVDVLATGVSPIAERDGDPRKGVRWRLRSEVTSALGTAVTHRARAEVSRSRVEAHLAEYGWITNKTVRNLFNLDVQQARQLLADLRTANVLVKDPSGPARGPGVRWLPKNARRRA